MINNAIIVVMLFMICVISVFIILSKDLIITVFGTGVFSIFSVVTYSMLKAPDVAMTEVAVNASLSTVLLLLVISIIRKKNNNQITIVPIQKQRKKAINFDKVIKIVACTAFATVLLIAIYHFPDFCSETSVVNTGAGEFYIRHTVNDFDVLNIVTAVLGGYRGFDTLIETTVIFAASFGVSQILLIGESGTKRNR